MPNLHVRSPFVRKPRRAVKAIAETLQNLVSFLSQDFAELSAIEFLHPEILIVSMIS